MVELFNHLFNPGDRDMDVGHRGAHPAITLVFHQHQRASLGDHEVDPGDPDLRVAELFAKHAPPDRDQRIDVLGVGNAGHLAREKRGDLLPGLVNRRHDDVAWTFAGELHDVLAHVGLKAIDAVLSHAVIEFDLLAHHRLALDHAVGAVRLRDFKEDPVGFFGRRGPVHGHTALCQFLVELLKQLRQVRQAVLADCLAHLAQALELGSVTKVRRTFALQKIHGTAKAAPQIAVFNCAAGVGFEMPRIDKGERGLRAGTARRAHDCTPVGPSRSSISTMISSFGPCAP